MEKKQHDSWVTVRQESRKLTEAQNEMQTLRARLTVAETKLAEKTVEIDNLMQENQTMKETMDRINNHQILKPDNTSKYLFSLRYTGCHIWMGPILKGCFWYQAFPLSFLWWKMPDITKMPQQQCLKI